MRSNDVFKRAFNRALTDFAAWPVGSDLGSEAGLARTLGISRTTVRTLIETLAARGVIGRDGRRKWIARPPTPADRFPETETESVRSLVERRFMELIINHDIHPGQQVNTLDLARQFSVSPSAVREYLSDFSQCGLLARRPNSSWIFRGFDEAFAEELSRVRQLFEIDAALRFADLADDDPLWRRLDDLEAEHRVLIAAPAHPFVAFSRLDETFHLTVNAIARNRFVDNFQALVRIVFHYHYQWRKDDERQRNRVALDEHLACIAAFRSRDRERIRDAVQSHLDSARLSLIASIARGGSAAAG
jgi:DNA-binding GntR family transcriptional regulator